jgi:hypothetical protein
MSKAEYYNPPSNNQGCSYASLGRYNGGCGCKEVTIQPYQGPIIIPTYDAPGYNNLTKGGCGCGNHRSLKNAYDGGCNQKYSNRPCNSCSFGCGGNQYVGINPVQEEVIVDDLIFEPIEGIPVPGYYTKSGAMRPSQYIPNNGGCPPRCISYGNGACACPINN